jgi:amino acid transporter
MIAFMYIVGTFAILALVPAADLDPKSGVFHALAIGSTLLKVGILGVIAAVLVTVGNAGGVGSTVAGIARVPFVVGIDRYLPAAFGKIHPKWKTPYVSILVQAGLSGAVLLISQINQSTRDSYQQLIDAAIILYFIPFLYMFLAAIKLSYRKDRASDPHAVLIPGGIPGVWIASGIAFAVTLLSIAFSVYPPGDASDRLKFQLRLLAWVIGALGVGLALYWRGARSKRLVSD